MMSCGRLTLIPIWERKEMEAYQNSYAHLSLGGCSALLTELV